MSKKILIITYYWPPSGGAGVQRWLKFSKYLPEFGWEPYILTVDPNYAAYPLKDESLLTDLQDSVKVFRTPAINYFKVYNTDPSRLPAAGFASSAKINLKEKFFRFIRGNFFLPDPRRGWNKFAFKEACRLIESESINHIITTSPPHSTQLIGLKLKKRFSKIKWIADLRDPWTEIYYYKQFYPTFISEFIDTCYEKNILLKADKVITVGNSLKKSYSSKGKDLEKKIEVITNGYDEADFKNLVSSEPSNLTITYVGTLSDNYPVNGLINAIKSIYLKVESLKLSFVGSVSGNVIQTLQDNIREESLEFLPYVTHEEAIKHMMSSSILVLIIPQHKSNKSIITGKIFEYLASGKPILCIGPIDGDAAEIIKETGAGIMVDYNDTKKISEFITDIQGRKTKSDISYIQRYSRINLTKKLVEIVSEEGNTVNPN